MEDDSLKADNQLHCQPNEEASGGFSVAYPVSVAHHELLRLFIL